MPYLKPRDAAILIRLMAAERPCNCMEIGRDSGLYPNGSAQTWAELGRSLIYPLTNLGAAAKCGRNPLRYEITERGRIAVALFRVIEDRKREEAA